MMRNAVALATLLFLTASPSYGRVQVTEHTVKLAEGEAPAKTSVNDMGWLVGRWTGDGLGGRTEETWTAPEAGVMLGTFRLIRDGKPVFYEFLTLSETDRGLAMRLKHFHPDLTGWEEREKVIEFRYVARDGNMEHFEGLTFRRDSETALTIFLALRSKDGTLREEKFQMKRLQ